MKNARLILFLKSLIPGRVKTRIARAWGAENALLLYRAMIEDLMSNLSPIEHSIVPYVDSNEHNASLISLKKLMKRPLRVQKGKDLGMRMYNAFYDIFGEGIQKALLIGSDIPQIDHTLIHDYSVALDKYQAVIGPTYDGGYFLIGFRKEALHEGVFRNISWSTSHVLSQTITRARDAKIKIFVGDMLEDVDTLDALESIMNTPHVRQKLTHVNNLFHRIKGG